MESYEDFINNILNTRGRFACGDEYHERHHIVPKCMGGNNDKENLIDLFAKEHFIAHKMLALENPDNYSVVYAWWCMSTMKSKSTNERYQVSAEEYEEARIVHSKARKEFLSNPENCSMYGKCHTAEARERMSELAKERFKNPENHPMFGRKLSTEQIEKLRQSRLGRPAWNKGLSVFVGEDNPFYGKHHTEETKEIIRQKKLQWIEENGVPFKGEHHTEETKQQLREMAIERFKDPEFRQKHSDTQKKRFENQAEREKLSDAHSIAVYQLSETLDIIAEYKNAIVASEQTGVNKDGIWRCCDFAQITAGGYHWMYKKDYEAGKKPLTNNPKNNQPVPIVQLTLNDEFVCEYQSMKEAYVIHGYDRASINKCCLHQRTQAYGFHWVTKEEYEKILTQQNYLENNKELKRR